VRPDFLAAEDNAVYGTTGGAVYDHDGGAAIAYSGSSDGRFLIGIEAPPNCIKVVRQSSRSSTRAERLFRQAGSSPRSSARRLSLKRNRLRCATRA
jgi:hypothetical protein